ncbi:MAG: redoxin domain-containing protein [bacterium]|nr:redoxin domain-containing protein [bacterium]
MRPLIKWFAISAALTALIITVSGPAYGQPAVGGQAPAFALEDVGGKRHDLAAMQKHPMVILYFFDVASRPSQEGLLALDDLAGRFAEANLKALGITRSAKPDVVQFVSQSRITYPVLLDNSKVSELYQARFVLPTICILGPGLKVLDYIQGGGKTTEIMLVKLAEKELQRKQTAIAKAISEDVVRRNPQNVEAKMVKGYAELKDGDLAAAEKTFNSLSQSAGQGKVLGDEGMVSVYARKGQTKKALELAARVEKKAPDRGHVNTVKADILYAQGQKNEAQKEYQKAAGKPSAAPYQKAVALNKLGRLQASLGKLPQARELYDQAVAIDPYYIEATANSAKTYEKEGKWDKALDTYRQALALNKDDVFAATLAKRARSMVALQNDVERKKRLDGLVKRLAERYRKQQQSKPTEPEDTWTSRPLIMTFVDFQEKGGLSERDGLSSVLMLQLSDQLNASGRIQVVERILIEKLLEELDLGSSDLADPDTALRLGKVLAAKIIGSGSIFYLPNGNILSLRLIDTETSAVPKIINRQFGPSLSLDKELNLLNHEILTAVKKEYPLQGYIVQASSDRILINLGSKQGVSQDTKFEVIKEKEPIKYKGKILHGASEVVALLQMVQVEPDLSYARILDQQSSIARDDKIQEKVENQ